MTPPPRTSTFTIVDFPAAAVLSRKSLRSGKRKQGSGHPLQGVAEHRHDVVDVATLDNQRRRHCKGVTAVTEHEAAVEAVDHDVIATHAGRIRPRRQFARPTRTEGAD